MAVFVLGERRFFRAAQGIEQNKNFVQKRVALNRFFSCFRFSPFRKDNYFTEVFLVFGCVPG